MFNLPQKVKDDAKRYKESHEKFLKGEMKEAFFRGIRVPWGNYSQRGGKSLMSRLRIPAGILSFEQLKAIGNAAKSFGSGRLHITTRQDIQIHDVSFENSIKIVEYLEKFDISPRGGGGNTIRNITSCYLSGICEKEAAEVYKIVWGLTEYLLSKEDSYNLPRKFKISFSGCGKDCAFAGVNDLGFIAQDAGFKVICGGGMGAKSSVGRVLETRIREEDIGYVVAAVISVFNKYGDRKNRHRNRLRFLIGDIGWQRFVELYGVELQNVKEKEYIVLKTSDTLGSNGFDYIHLRIPFGEIDGDKLIKLSEIGDIIPTIHFRTTPRQNLIIANVPKDKLAFVYEKVGGILTDYLLPETVLDVISCKAATTCNLGICNAIALAPEIVARLKKMNLDFEKLADFKINLSGCSNSCGQHPIGTLSFSGLAKKVYNRTVPFYRVYFGGRVDAEKTKFAQEVGIVPAKVIPQLAAEFIKDPNNKDYLISLVKKYSYVPTYEEDKSYYIDFGKGEEFSLDGLSQGECGAGVIDMIESDLESAKQSIINRDFKNAIIYSSRALLIVKGIDPKDEKEAIYYFIEKFVKPGIADSSFADLDKKYLTEIAPAYVEKLYNEVKSLYYLMDSNFNFPKNRKKSMENEDGKGEIYDLRGTPCPINYVKAKLKLEELNAGEILEIYLDDGEPIENVPKSLQNDGQDVEVIPKENYFRVIVKKKV